MAGDAADLVEQEQVGWLDHGDSEDAFDQEQRKHLLALQEVAREKRRL